MSNSTSAGLSISFKGLLARRATAVMAVTEDSPEKGGKGRPAYRDLLAKLGRLESEKQVGMEFFHLQLLLMHFRNKWLILSFPMLCNLFLT